ncbi:MAG: DUF3109 family protein [Ignavibacteriales bacterium]|nr:DUF3109 family protein [Ignavibacteriales bacterium]
MAERKFRSLKNHNLSYIPDLKIDPVIFDKVFAAGCSLSNCNARCCREGVLIDPQDKAKILAHAETIKRSMDEHQEHDHAKWFDGVAEPDADFPSGRCEGTRVIDGGCVFLNSRGWCVLQKAAVEEGMEKWKLKPFFCVAYPLTIDAGVLTMCEPEFADRPECCSTVADGTQTVLEVCEEEIYFLLGEEGARQLRSSVIPSATHI